VRRAFEARLEEAGEVGPETIAHPRQQCVSGVKVRHNRARRGLIAP
jgi:hypothetical protein